MKKMEIVNGKKTNYFRFFYLKLSLHAIECRALATWIKKHPQLKTGNVLVYRLEGSLLLIPFFFG